MIPVQFRNACAVLALVLCSPVTSVADGVRLYALDCGRLVFKDLRYFDDTVG